MQHKETVKGLILQSRKRFDKAANVPPNERYWSTIVACALAGGIIANKLDLCNFDMDTIYHWAIEHIKTLRAIVKENVKDARTLLVEYMNLHIMNTIVTRGLDGDRIAPVDVEPKASLLIRNEIEKGICYISKNAIRDWLIKGGSDYNSVKTELMSARILLDDNRKITLSKGSAIAKTGQLDTNMAGKVLVPINEKKQEVELKKKLT